MKKIFIYIIFPVTFFVSGCNDKDKVDEHGTNVPAQYVVILCDVSKSIDSGHKAGDTIKSRLLTNLIVYCKSIIRNYKPETQFDFVFVSRNAANPPFCEFKSILYNSLTKVSAKKKFRETDSILEKKITQKFNAPEPQTCLLTSIENIYKSISAKYYDNPGIQTDFIIISDMIEVCDASPLGKSKMSAMQKNLIVADEKKLINYKPQNINFSKAGTNLKIIQNTSGIDSKVNTQLENLWRTILYNYGFMKVKESNYPLFRPMEELQRNDAYLKFN